MNAHLFSKERIRLHKFSSIHTEKLNNQMKINFVNNCTIMYDEIQYIQQNFILDYKEFIK